MNEIVIGLYDVTAGLGALFLAFVLRQAMNDLHLKRVDPVSVQNARRYAFIGSAAFLVFTVCFQNYWLVHPSVIAVGLVATGLMLGLIWVLAVNVIAFRLRAPPKPQDGFKIAPTRLWHKIL